MVTILVGMLAALATVFPFSANKAGSVMMTLVASVRSGAEGIAFSPDGRLLAAAYSNGTVWLWDPATNQRRSLAAPASSPVRADGVAFSADGKLLAAAYSNGAIRLWNPGTGQAVGSPVQSDSGGVNAVVFGPDGLLAAACANGAVWLWSPATGHRHGLAAPASSPIEADGVAFSPGGKLLAAAYSTGAIALWNPGTGQTAGSLLQGSSGGVNAVAFSPDGKQLAAAYGNSTIRLWNPDGGQQGGSGIGSWLVAVAAVIAILLAALAIAVTARAIYPGLSIPGRQ